MRLFGEKSISITLIDDDDISFIFLDGNDEYHLLEKLSHEQFLGIDKDSDITPERSRGSRLNLLFLPDYWIGHASYQFRSRKKLLVEGFVERKLNSEYSSELPWIANFYEYTFYQDLQGEQGVDVYFPHEPKFFQLYEQLEACDILPAFITTPAFIWEKKLKKMISDFDAGENCFIDMLQSECFLYFFSKGRFLFSRGITFPDFQTGDHDRFEALTYEINQSLHLFSQKARSEVGRIYLSSPGEEDVDRLSGMLDIEVEGVHPIFGRSQTVSGDITSVGPISFFDADDLSPAKRFLNITHKARKKTHEWRTVQRAGVIIGILVFLLIGVGSLYLLQSDRFRVKKSDIMPGSDPTQALVQYNEVLDELIMEVDRPNPSRLILGLVKSLPEDVWMREMGMDTGSGMVDFRGMIRADDLERLNILLSGLLDNMKREIPYAETVRMKDVDIEELKNENRTGPREYLISFRFKVS